MTAVDVDENWEIAARRCDFQLNYSRAAQSREFGPGQITGGMIDDAYKPGETSPGEWAGDRPDLVDRHTDPAVDTWIDSYAAMAVSEAVHEALEWFRVDGEPWLDPHGKYEAAIHAAAARFASELAGMRRGGAASS